MKQARSAFNVLRET